MKNFIRFMIHDSRLKNILVGFVFLITCYLSLVTSVSAQTSTSSAKSSPTPTKTSVKSTVDEQINNLKDKIASRVAQLKLVERRGIIGSVTEVSQTQITITDIKGETRFLDVDELTKFSSPSAKESFGISDISKGTKLGVLGLYNKQTRRLLSRFVDVMVLPQTVRGVVSSVDAEEFTVEVTTETGTKSVDIENITKTTSYDKNGDATKSGFSKIKEGQRIVVIGFESKTDKNRIVASRVLLFPDIPANPKLPKVSVEKEDIPVSTGSGNKLQPITR